MRIARHPDFPAERKVNTSTDVSFCFGHFISLEMLKKSLTKKNQRQDSLITEENRLKIHLNLDVE